MLQLDLTREDQEVLLSSLQALLSNLRKEIASTDHRDFRDILNRREKVLDKVVETLRVSLSPAQAA